MPVESANCPEIDVCDDAWFDYVCCEEPRSGYNLYTGECPEDWYTYVSCETT